MMTSKPSLFHIALIEYFVESQRSKMQVHFKNYFLLLLRRLHLPAQPKMSTHLVSKNRCVSADPISPRGVPLAHPSFP
jgi:hypothetical protein